MLTPERLTSQAESGGRDGFRVVVLDSTEESAAEALRLIDQSADWRYD